MKKKTLIARDFYLNRLIDFKDTDMIKVITGIRRCGKSILMGLMQEYLLNNGVSEKQIISINFESMVYSDMDVKTLYEYVCKNVVSDKKIYLFFDEVQLVKDWQKAINSFRVDIDCDIYITGSNAYLLSSELSTYLSGRYIEIKVLPLSFREFIDFHGYRLKEKILSDKSSKKIIYDAENDPVDARDIFDLYVKYGGMPSIADVGLDVEKVSAVLDGIYSAVIVRDILERKKHDNIRQINDAVLLRKIMMFLADNIGNNTSSNSIKNTLINEKLIDNRPAVQTVSAYVNALTEAFVFYEIQRFDIKGREYLKTLGKYYIVDIGLRNYLLGNRGDDSGHILENIIYFELLRRGYEVSVGKINNKEIDFIAVKTNEKKYIQVTETMVSEETRQRELAPLTMVDDNYEKFIITMDKPIVTDIDGIRIINALDWLLNE
ncbi:MAG: ATP-binding protein [Oscillospiraceae bacterium]|nr:ATP-binding protein [Oscillospiraceae bacterium]